MIISQEKRLADLEGFDNAPQQFKIKQNARAFEILSSNIYSDKILAVVRELGCNALDAHKAAGKENVPFDVHLPNNFEPWFSIRDYGIGLDDKDVMNLYTTYFESTKASSNDFVGCLGLGSKSFFAYTDQATITAWFNGVKRTYSAFVDESGAPSITRLSEEPTTEGNGLQIHMPVNSNDFNSFSDRARKVFHRFKTLPNVKGNTGCVLTNITYLMEHNNYKIRKNNDFTPGGGCYVIQGSVAYPIEYNAIDDKLFENYPGVREMIRRAPIDIEVPIGSVGITASRERLDYNKLTQKNLVDICAAVYKDLPNQFVDVLKGAKTFYEAKILYNKWHSSADNYFVREIVKDQLAWKGIKIDHKPLTADLYDEVQATDDQGVVKTRTTWDGKIEPVMEKKFWAVALRFGSDSLRSDRYSAITESELKLDIDYLVSNRYKIILVDKNVRSLSRTIRHNFGSFNGYVITIKPTDDARFKKVLRDDLGGLPDTFITKLSDLEEPPVVASMKAEVRKVFEVKNFRSYGYFDRDEVTINVADGGRYVLLYQGEMVKPKDNKPGPGSANNKYPHGFFLMGQLNWNSEKPIYAFNSTHKSIPLNNPKWVPAYKEIEDKMRPLLTNKANKKLLEAISQIAYMVNDSEIKHLIKFYNLFEDPRYANELTTFKTNSTLNKVYVKMKAIKDLVSPLFQVGSLEMTWEMLGHRALDFIKLVEYVEKTFGIVSIVNFNSLIKPTFGEELLATYPLLFKMVIHYRHSNSDHFSFGDIAHYIRLIDAARKADVTINKTY